MSVDNHGNHQSSNQLFQLSKLLSGLLELVEYDFLILLDHFKNENLSLNNQKDKNKINIKIIKQSSIIKLLCYLQKYLLAFIYESLNPITPSPPSANPINQANSNNNLLKDTFNTYANELISNSIKSVNQTFRVIKFMAIEDRNKIECQLKYSILYSLLPQFLYSSFSLANDDLLTYNYQLSKLLISLDKLNRYLPLTGESEMKELKWNFLSPSEVANRKKKNKNIEKIPKAASTKRRSTSTIASTAGSGTGSGSSSTTSSRGGNTYDIGSITSTRKPSMLSSLAKPSKSPALIDAKGSRITPGRSLTDQAPSSLLSSAATSGQKEQKKEEEEEQQDYLDDDSNEDEYAADMNKKEYWLINFLRLLGKLLGYNCRRYTIGDALSKEEIQMENWLHNILFNGGLSPIDYQIYSYSDFMKDLIGSKQNAPLVDELIRKMNLYSRNQLWLVGKDDEDDILIQTLSMILACLLKHHNCISTAKLYALDKSEESVLHPPKKLSMLFQGVCIARDQINTLLQKEEQDHELTSSDYSMVCQPIIDRCKFLLFEIIAATPGEEYHKNDEHTSIAMSQTQINTTGIQNNSSHSSKHLSPASPAIQQQFNYSFSNHPINQVRSPAGDLMIKQKLIKSPKNRKKKLLVNYQPIGGLLLDDDDDISHSLTDHHDFNNSSYNSLTKSANIDYSMHNELSDPIYSQYLSASPSPSTPSSAHGVNDSIKIEHMPSPLGMYSNNEKGGDISIIELKVDDHSKATQLPKPLIVSSSEETDQHENEFLESIMGSKKRSSNGKGKKKKNKNQQGNELSTVLRRAVSYYTGQQQYNTNNTNEDLATVISTLKRFTWLRKQQKLIKTTRTLRESIIDFLFDNSIDIELLKTSMKHQQKRAEKRENGLKETLKLLSIHLLIDSVKFQIFRGSFDLWYLQNELNHYRLNIQASQIVTQQNIEIVSHKIYNNLIYQLQKHVSILKKATKSNLFNESKYNKHKWYTLHILQILACPYQAVDDITLVSCGIIPILSTLLKPFSPSSIPAPPPSSSSSSSSSTGSSPSLISVHKNRKKDAIHAGNGLHHVAGGAPSIMTNHPGMAILSDKAMSILQSILATIGIHSSSINSSILKKIESLLHKLLEQYRDEDKSDKLTDLLCFLRRILVCKKIIKYFLTPNWIELLLSIINKGTLRDRIMSLRVLDVLLLSLNFDENRKFISTILNELLKILSFNLILPNIRETAVSISENCNAVFDKEDCKLVKVEDDGLSFSQTGSSQISDPGYVFGLIPISDGIHRWRSEERRVG